MNDAYTIGITLALENGVSAGIQEIRRDLEELNRTVDASIGELVRLDAQVGATLRAVHQAARDSGLMQIAEAGQRLATRPSAITVPPVPSREVESELPEHAAPSVASGIPVVRKETIALPSVAVRGEPVPLIMREIPAQPTFAAPTAPTLPRGAPPTTVAVPPRPAAPPPSTAPLAPIAPSQLMPLAKAPSPSRAEVASAGYKSELPRAPAELPDTAGSPKVGSTAAHSLSTVAPTEPTQILQASDLTALARGLATLSAVTPSEHRPIPSPRNEARSGTYGPSAVPALPTAGFWHVEGSSAQPTHQRPLAAAPFAAHATDSRHDLRGEAVIAIGDSTKEPAAPTTVTAPRAGMSMMPPFVANSAGATLGGQEQSAGSEMGHIFLDGQLVGRWMREHLAELAAKPPSGPTSFDPKLGMIWPGAPIQA